MKFAATSASALALLFALSACGGGAEDSEAVPTEAPAATDAAPAMTASEAPAEAATPTPEPSETAAAPTPTPTPSPAATRAAAPVAVAEPAAFAMCKACHSVEPGKNGIGPSLAGIWGEKAGAVPGFDFSDAMKSSGLVWNQSGLDRYLADPRGVVPGTKMAFGGMKDAAKRREVIDYIKGL